MPPLKLKETRRRDRFWCCGNREGVTQTLKPVLMIGQNTHKPEKEHVPIGVYPGGTRGRSLTGGQSEHKLSRRDQRRQKRTTSRTATAGTRAFPTPSLVPPRRAARAASETSHILKGPYQRREVGAREGAGAAGRVSTEGAGGGPSGPPWARRRRGRVRVGTVVAGRAVRVRGSTDTAA